MADVNTSSPAIESAEIDVEAKTVRGFSTEMSIKFPADSNGVGAHGVSKDTNGAQVFVSFYINRITGKTSVVRSYGDWVGSPGARVAWVWDLICRPARPLF